MSDREIPSDWEVLDLEPDDPWREHVLYMLENWGCRDPECLYCGARVVMALQFFHGGAIWTTDRDAEGPISEGLGGPATECPASPDGWHHAGREPALNERPDV